MSGLTDVGDWRRRKIVEPDWSIGWSSRWSSGIALNKRKQLGEAEAEEISSAEIVRRILENIEVP